MTWRGHRVREQDPTVADGALVLEEDRGPSPKADLAAPSVNTHDLDNP